MEIADFLYHAMVLMVEKGLTWEDIVKELADLEAETLRKHEKEPVCSKFCT